MKYIITILALILTSTLANANPWCQWDEKAKEAINCVYERNGVIPINGVPTRTIERRHDAGFYEMVETWDIITSEEKHGDSISVFDSKQILKNWPKIAKTQEDLDAEKVASVSEREYQIFDALKTIQDEINKTAGKPIDVIPADIKDATSTKAGQ